MIKMVAAALYYAERGWRIVPNHDVAAGQCSCRLGAECSSAGKHPRITSWQTDASCDPDTVSRWWTTWPHANVGILTGAATGMFVLDVDGAAGDESLMNLEDENTALPRTAEARSGSGGRHFFFVHPGGTIQNCIGIKPGLDMRGDAGQILVEPSRTLKGAYRWIRHPETCETADATEWFIDLIRRAAR